MTSICAVQLNSHWSYLATEHLKYDECNEGNKFLTLSDQLKLKFKEPHLTLFWIAQFQNLELGSFEFIFTIPIN